MFFVFFLADHECFPATQWPGVAVARRGPNWTLFYAVAVAISE